MVEIALKNTYSTPFIIFLFQNHFILAKFFWKTNISYPLIYTSTSACHGVRNVSFPKNFADGLNKWYLTEFKIHARVSTKFILLYV